VRPPELLGDAPVIVYGHGGGWVLGDRHTHDRLTRDLAMAAHAAVVFVDYARAPEHHHPVQVEQGAAVLEWIAEGSASRLDPQRVAVAGDSSGANLATVWASIEQQRSGRQLAAQVLFFPTVDARFDTPSYAAYADGSYLDEAAMRWFWDQYLPDSSQRADPTASPLRAPVAALRGLPPALVITAEADVLRDEGEAYARRLQDAGVEVHRHPLPRHHSRLRRPRRAREHARGARRHRAGRRLPPRTALELTMALEIRPIRATDAACLTDAWTRTSPESRHRRMNGTLASLRPAELRYLTHVDHHNHEAMVAIDTDTGRLVGVMRYIRTPGHPDEAELAALVVDDWQRRGVARALYSELTSHAVADGVERYRAIVSPQNAPVIAALRRLGATPHPHDGELRIAWPIAGDLTSRETVEKALGAAR
jgi:acetyl esterase/lipase/ribosomal protein S18 acetylase RimI-like enzyme